MKTVEQHQPVTIERIERGLAAAAFFVMLYGQEIVPIFEKLERELVAMRAGQDAMGRARQLIESYRERGGVKAIR